MTTTQSAKGFMVQMKNYFGLLPGQSLAGFAAEVNSLLPEEKVEFSKMLNEAGVKTEPPRPDSKGCAASALHG